MVCMHIHTCTHTHAHIKKNKMPPFATIWANLGDIINEINHTQGTNITWCHLYEQSKIVKLIETENKIILSSCWEEGYLGEGKWTGSF